MNIMKVADIIKNSFEDPKPESGYYIWWFPEEVANELIKPLTVDRQKIQVKQIDGQLYYALYFGIASSKGGLRQRIKWHTAVINPHTPACVQNRTLSTLRQTICGLKEWRMAEESTEDKVNQIINECYWEWEKHATPHVIEKRELNNVNACYPLNIRGNNTVSKECRKELIRLRSKFRK